MKFRKSRDFEAYPKDTVLVFEDKCGDVLTITHQGEQGDIFIRVNGSNGVWLKRHRAIKLALRILDELEPLHTWG